MIVLGEKLKALCVESKLRKTNSPPPLLRSEKELLKDYISNISK
jgi:hypothetical protein